MRFGHAFFLLVVSFFFGIYPPLAFSADNESRYARSDSLSGYVHWIELMDDQVNKIDPNEEQPRPYSPLKTCGRCHDYNTISHGWHFDAVERDHHGRPGQPWIWNDARTGTNLPLSYRKWKGTFDPDELGITRWAVAKQFGGYLTGGGPGSPESLKVETVSSADSSAEVLKGEGAQNRSEITGPLPIDCMLCHRNDRSYSPETWSKQIADENFAYAPTVAAGLATIVGSMERIRTKPDPTATSDSMPKLKYDASRFRDDGKVFFDVIRKPSNNSCNYCHTNLAAETFGSNRWTHDDDVHIRAGMACADCHRNGLDHQIVRGFDGESHPHPESIASLSCRGCHIGSERHSNHATSRPMAGRMGAPMPAHRGLPTLHFEKLACTACHSGPVPDLEPTRIMNSIAHGLGSHAHRTSEDLPGIVAPIILNVKMPSSSLIEAMSKTGDGLRHNTNSGDEIDEKESIDSEYRYTPHRMTWPAYWGVMKDQVVKPLEPEGVYQLTRGSLKVRKDFSEELIAVKPSSSDRKSILGEDRAKVKEAELTDEEREKLEAWAREKGQSQLRTRLADAMTAIEKANPEQTAVYIAGGVGYRKSADGSDSPIEEIPAKDLDGAAAAYAWPMAHDVRPARMSLGVQGCWECHSHDSAFFSSQVTAVGTLPGFQTVSTPVHELQGVDMARMTQWNTLFEGRTPFKLFAFFCLGLLAAIVLGSLAWSIGRRISRMGAL